MIEDRVARMRAGRPGLRRGRLLVRPHGGEARRLPRQPGADPAPLSRERRLRGRRRSPAPSPGTAAPTTPAPSPRSTRLIAARPDDPYYHELAGQFLLEAGTRGRGGRRPTAQAVALAPKEPLILGGLGRALLNTGDDAATIAGGPRRPRPLGGDGRRRRRRPARPRARRGAARQRGRRGARHRRALRARGPLPRRRAQRPPRRRPAARGLAGLAAGRGCRLPSPSASKRARTEDRMHRLLAPCRLASPPSRPAPRTRPPAHSATRPSWCRRARRAPSPRPSPTPSARRSTPRSAAYLLANPDVLMEMLQLLEEKKQADAARRTIGAGRRPTADALRRRLLLRRRQPRRRRHHRRVPRLPVRLLPQGPARGGGAARRPTGTSA